MKTDLSATMKIGVAVLILSLYHALSLVRFVILLGVALVYSVSVLRYFIDTASSFFSQATNDVRTGNVYSVCPITVKPVHS